MKHNTDILMKYLLYEMIEPTSNDCCIVYTELCNIKLTKCSLIVRLRSGSGICIMSFLLYGLRYLNTLYVGWSLVRRRVTHRLPRLQTVYNVLKYHKTFLTIRVVVRFLFKFTQVHCCT